jgi:hypothetical protein
VTADVAAIAHQLDQVVLGQSSSPAQAELLDQLSNYAQVVLDQLDHVVLDQLSNYDQVILDQLDHVVLDQLSNYDQVVLIAT